MGMLLAFRFLAGCAGAAPLAVGGGTIADMISPEERGKYMALFSVGALIGPVLGPVAGGFLTEAAGWRWTFWLLVIIVGFCSFPNISQRFLFQNNYIAFPRKTPKSSLAAVDKCNE